MESEWRNFGIFIIYLGVLLFWIWLITDWTEEVISVNEEVDSGSDYSYYFPSLINVFEFTKEIIAAVAI